MGLIMMEKIAAGLILALAATGAQAVAVSSITITGGTFSIGPPDPLVPCASATSSGFSSCLEIAVGGANIVNAGDIGIAKTDTTAFSPDIVHFNLLGNTSITTGLAPTVFAAEPARDWANGFSGDATGGAISLNLGGFYFNWNGSNILQGTDSSGANGTSTAAVGMIDETGNFDIRWQSAMNTPFAGQTGYWHLTGTAALVPEASTYAMMLAGLGLVGGVVARRRGQIA